MSNFKDAANYFKFASGQGAVDSRYAKIAVQGIELLDQIQRQEALIDGYSLHELVMVANMLEDLDIHPSKLRKMCSDMRIMYEVLLLYSSIKVTRTITGNQRAVRQYPDFRTVMNAMKGDRRNG